MWGAIHQFNSKRAYNLARCGAFTRHEARFLGNMAWGDTPRATIGLKPLISCALRAPRRAMGLLKPHVSLIYTFSAKSRVTGTDIKNLRNHNFEVCCSLGLCTRVVVRETKWLGDNPRQRGWEGHLVLGSVACLGLFSSCTRLGQPCFSATKASLALPSLTQARPSNTHPSPIYTFSTKS